MVFFHLSLFLGKDDLKTLLRIVFTFPVSPKFQLLDRHVLHVDVNELRN